MRVDDSGGRRMERQSAAERRLQVARLRRIEQPDLARAARACAPRERLESRGLALLDCHDELAAATMRDVVCGAERVKELPSARAESRLGTAGLVVDAGVDDLAVARTRPRSDAIGGFDDDDITASNPGLSGHTAITMNRSDSGSGTTSGGAGYLIKAATGASGTSTFALTASEEYRGVTIGIAPAP